jgi:predicted protein tyrosine phosphatase
LGKQTANLIPQATLVEFPGLGQPLKLKTLWSFIMYCLNGSIKTENLFAQSKMCIVRRSTNNRAEIRYDVGLNTHSKTALKHILFVCSQNRLRSPTAEHIFSDYPGIECTSAGTNQGADNPLTPELIEWADLIFVMENTHRKRMASKFQRHLAKARIICLGIPDDYEFMDPELVTLLQAKVTPFLPDCA